MIGKAYLKYFAFCLVVISSAAGARILDDLAKCPDVPAFNTRNAITQFVTTGSGDSGVIERFSQSALDQPSGKYWDTKPLSQSLPEDYTIITTWEFDRDHDGLVDMLVEVFAKAGGEGPYMAHIDFEKNTPHQIDGFVKIENGQCSKPTDWKPFAARKVTTPP